MVPRILLSNIHVSPFFDQFKYSLITVKCQVIAKQDLAQILESCLEHLN